MYYMYVDFYYKLQELFIGFLPFSNVLSLFHRFLIVDLEVRILFYT